MLSQVAAGVRKHSHLLARQISFSIVVPPDLRRRTLSTWILGNVASV